MGRKIFNLTKRQGIDCNLFCYELKELHRGVQNVKRRGMGKYSSASVATGKLRFV
jgi:hypothetical protein